MTPGQRQSALVLVPLTVALVFYGRPAHEQATTSAPPITTSPIEEFASPTPAVTPEPDLDRPGETPRPSDRRPSGEPTDVRPPDGGPEIGGGPDVAHPATPSVDPPPRVVAAVRPTPEGDSVGDADFAAAFLGRTPGVSRIEVDDSDSCRSLLEHGNMVVAGAGLGPGLRQCLVDSGAVVVAHDSLGDLPPNSAGGQVLSTRRGLGAGLVEATEFFGERTFDGPVGVVSLESARAVIEDTVPAMRAAGADVAVVAYVDADDALSITGAVIDFARTGVTTTVLAAPVAEQRAWTDQASLLAPDTSYVVADAFDTTLTADYGTGFDGAQLLTTQTYAWDLTPSPARRACDARWAGAGGGVLGPTAAVRMYAWCQHADLVEQIVTGASPVEAVRSTTYPSAITTLLGPVGDAGWGPTQQVLLTWQSACGCWVRAGQFTDRSPSPTPT